MFEVMDGKSVQVKVRVAPKLADAFKAQCREKEITLTDGITQLIKASVGNKELKSALPDVATRKQRRREVNELINRLNRVNEAEDAYKSRIPENLQGSEAYGLAEQSIEVMQEILERMSEIYS